MTELIAAGVDFVGYRIEEEIGRGGMGVVYRAYDLRLKRTVALKLVAPSLARHERFRERFARESELVMSLEHPNVVPIYDAGDADGRVYLAMRLVDGTDLGSLLRAEGALEVDSALAICRQIAAALDAAHAGGLAHRDVKPSNILLDSSRHAYLADFGLTRRLEDEAFELGEDTTVGTPAYLAPEQLEGRPVDGRADVYALGCVLYECLTGEPVFVRSSRLALAWAHLEEDPPRPSSRRAGLPTSLDGVIARAMAKEPEQRFESCAALVSAAHDALGLGKSGPTRLRRSLILAGAMGLAIIIAGGVIATTLNRGGKAVFAGPNTLARIDVATNTVSKVFHVGTDPVVAAGADHTVWVYNRGGGTISQIDGATNKLVETKSVSPPAECCSLFTGPVLAADASGAWFLQGGSAAHSARLVHLLVGSGGKVEYPLRLTATGVAASRNTVWVVGHDSRGNAVLRINPVTGHVAATVRFPNSARIDSIAAGYGYVWVMSSTTATLYRIDPRSPKRVKKLVVGGGRAARPQIMPRAQDIFVRVTGGYGTTYSVDPYRLTISGAMGAGFGPLRWEEDEGSLGSLWWYHQPDGTVNRQEVANGPIVNIQVTRSRPADGGPCITGIAIASGSLWVTVAPPSSRSVCRR
ncbi:MAG TPA: protein kinase [Gaiellaceae bacterium]|nr:protein kinase [Gaiellaceae bacterium]